MKRCGACNQVKQTNEFGLNRSQKDGLQARCKECRVEEARINNQMAIDYLNDYRNEDEGINDAAVRHFCENDGVVGMMKLLNKNTEVNGETDCLIWTAGKGHGYSKINVKLQSKPSLYRLVSGHRLVYAVFAGYDALPKADDYNGDAPVLDHRCGNPSCLNTLHLQVVSMSANSQLQTEVRQAPRFDELRVIA